MHAIMNRLHHIFSVLVVVMLSLHQSPLFPSSSSSGLAFAWTPALDAGVLHRHGISSSTTSLRMVVSDCFARDQGKELVERFGSVWEDDVEKVIAYETLLLTGSKLQILDCSLNFISDKARTMLGRRRWPIRFFSTRATMGCFDRLLQKMKSVPEMKLPSEGQKCLLEKEAGMSTEQYNLLRLLQTLSTYSGGVYALEGKVLALESELRP